MMVPVERHSHTKKFSEIRIGQFCIVNNKLYRKTGDGCGVRQLMDSFKLLRGRDTMIPQNWEVIPCYFSKPKDDKPDPKGSYPKRTLNAYAKEIDD